MTRAAIYCRYSDDELQNGKSIEDQERLCREYAKRNGWNVARVFADYGISGAFAVARPNFLSMVDAAKRGEFDTIIADDTDRLARNAAELLRLREDLEFIDIQIHTIADGHLTEMTAGFRGLMGSLHLKTLARNVRRGLAGVVHSKRRAGGQAYGYRTIAGKPGEPEIDPAEAAIVTRIFREFADNESPRKICARLNREGVKPPRGVYWEPSTLHGMRARGTGILANEIYIGRIVWNKVRMVKNPANGKRVSRPNPPAEWKTADVPHLRIIDQELWDRAQARRPVGSYTLSKEARRPRYLLSGLLRCGGCGASMTFRGADRKGVRICCAQYRNTGTCSHSRRYYIAAIEEMTLNGLRENLLSGPALDLFLADYRAERKRLAGEGASKIRDLERQLSDLDRKIRHGTEAILAAPGLKALAIELQKLESDKARIERELESAKDARTVVSLHPAALDSYRAKIDALAATLGDPARPHANELREAVRGLIERVTVVPSAAGNPVTIDVEGRLAQILTPAPAGVTLRFRLTA